MSHYYIFEDTLIPTNATIIRADLYLYSYPPPSLNGTFTDANYGFFLKIQNEVIYNSRIFVASYNNTHTTKYPKLVVVYR